MVGKLTSEIVNAHLNYSYQIGLLGKELEKVNQSNDFCEVTAAIYENKEDIEGALVGIGRALELLTVEIEHQMTGNEIDEAFARAELEAAAERDILKKEV